MDTQELVDEACPMISDYGWTYYFDATTVARGERLGLDPFAFYFLGRGGVLGDVESPVVQSAFGYFNPSVVATMWDTARAKVAPRSAGREYFEAAHDFGRARLSGVEELGAFVGAASKVLDAAKLDVAGLTLFAAAAAEPVPDDLPAAAMHLVAVLREFRGSAHLVAIVASGLSPRTAHFMRRPEMYTTFGWPDDDRPTVTDGDTAALAAADALTDRIVAPAYGALDDDDAVALLAGLRAIGPLLTSAPTPKA
jgi:hypothetical protein